MKVWQAVLVAAKSPSCLDPSGKAVDYFQVIKFPNGFDYAYADGNSALDKASGQLDSSTSAVSRTLAQAYSTSASIGHVLWNDEHPGGKKVGAPYAHMKGALAFDSSGGFWLTHSLPNFPGTTKSSMWSDGAPTYGQSYLCVSLSASTIEKLADLMVMDRPSVYAAKIGSSLASKYSKTNDWAVNGDHSPSGSSDSITLTVSSTGGQSFTVFGKDSNFGTSQNEDVYAALVAPKLGNLVVEVWRHGVGNFGPVCKGGVEVVDATSLSLLGTDWEATNDHSKWAVTQDGKWLCIGDVNRAQGQLKRGGGTWCSKTPEAKTMLSAVKAHDSCKKEVVV
jgi:deoxyribonuclease-2